MDDFWKFLIVFVIVLVFCAAIILVPTHRCWSYHEDLKDKGFVVTLASPIHAQDFVGDYNNIANLNYVSDDTGNGAPTSIGLAICQMQDYLQFGIDVPRSPHFLRWEAGREVPGSGDDIFPYHGMSSPWLMIRVCSEIGAPSLALCPRTTAGRFTQEMYDEAEMLRRPNGLWTLNEVPDYPSALIHLANNRGDAIQLATDGYDGYAILGVTTEGRGIWLRFYDGRNFNFNIRPGVVDTPTEQEGINRWNRMIQNNSLDPINYMTVWRMTR